MKSSRLELGDVDSGRSFGALVGSWEIFNHLEVSFFSAKMWV